MALLLHDLLFNNVSIHALGNLLNVRLNTQKEHHFKITLKLNTISVLKNLNVSSWLSFGHLGNLKKIKPWVNFSVCVVRETVGLPDLH